MSDSPYTREAMKARYDELCKQRDALNEQAAPARAEMERCANESEKWRVQAMEARTKVDEARGGRDTWFELKKEIGILARMLSGSK